MKTILTFTLMILVVGMVVGTPAFADSKLDSLVNLATQARSQVKLQLDKLPGVSDEVNTLYNQGSQETELLISAAKQGDVTQAKQHFLAAMKIFRQITATFSELPSASLKSTPAPQIDSAVLVNYKNDISRTEKYIRMLKDLATKNNFAVDFSRVDELIQTARSNLAENDIQSVERTIGELKPALAGVQNAIKEQTIQQQNERARVFANSYITKIDTILVQANQLGLSEGEIAKLIKAKEELASTNDPNRIIIMVKRYTVNFSTTEPQNQIQRILVEASKMDAKLAELEPSLDENIKPKFVTAKELVIQIKSQTSVDEATKLLRLLDSTIKEIENYVQSQRSQVNTQEETRSKPIEVPADQTTLTQERKQKEDAKNQKISTEISQLEARLGNIEPHVDENIKSKFDRAIPLLSKLKNQETVSNADYLRTVRMLDLLLDQMERYVKSLQAYEDTNPDQGTTKEQQNQEIESSEADRKSNQKDQ
ncbi:MAG: hypothetical protein ACT4NT_06710 [Nitrososphaerota archaeon]